MEHFIFTERPCSRFVFFRALHSRTTQTNRARHRLNVLLGVHGHLRGKWPATSAIPRWVWAADVSRHQETSVLRVSIFKPARSDRTGERRCRVMGLPR